MASTSRMDLTAVEIVELITNELITNGPGSEIDQSSSSESDLDGESWEERADITRGGGVSDTESEGEAMPPAFARGTPSGRGRQRKRRRGSRDDGSMQSDPDMQSDSEPGGISRRSILAIRRHTYYSEGLYCLSPSRHGHPSYPKIPQHRIKFKLKFFDSRDDDGIWTFFGPEVDFETNGMTFHQPVLMTIPTCYVPVDKDFRTTVKIQAQISDSWEDSDRSTVVDRKINFSIREFTPLRFRILNMLFEKIIAHMIYIRQEGENEYEVVWCFYDDLMETTLEAEKQMELRGFTSSGKSGTFLMRDNNDAKVALEIPNCDIEDPTRTIPAQKIWVSDAIVKVEFDIKNLGDGFKITDVAGQIRVGENEIIVP